MKRKIVVLITAYLLMGITNVLAANNVSIYVDEKLLQCEVSPYIENGRTMVPMRKIFEVLGATVEWDEETRRITATKDENTIIMTIDDSVMFSSNEGIQELDVAPVIVNNSTFVPLRAVSQSLNALVDWNGYTHTAFINSPNQYKNLNQAVTMYAPDGRTIAVLQSEIKSYQDVGWYLEPVTLMYAADGRTMYVENSEVDAYQDVGWYKNPVTKVYAADGRTMLINKSELNNYLKVGWYATYDEAQSANKLANQSNKSESNNAEQLKQNTQVKETSHQEHSFWAEEGAVIVGFDALNGTVDYKAKCPVCGKVGNETTHTAISGSRRNTHATCKNSKCSNWGKSFDVVIGHKNTTVYD